MAKLVATYAEGFFAVFTESRSGMQQRALIDIGGKVPTPKEMAELAGTLSDHWGWANVIETPTAKPAKQLPTVKRTREKEIPQEERERLTVGFLAKHPKSDAREIISGCGYEPDPKRIGRWNHSFVLMMKAQTIIAEQVAYRNGKHLVRKYVYSLPK